MGIRRLIFFFLYGKSSVYWKYNRTPYGVNNPLSYLWAVGGERIRPDTNKSWCQAPREERTRGLLLQRSGEKKKNDSNVNEMPYTMVYLNAEARHGRRLLFCRENMKLLGMNIN